MKDRICRLVDNSLESGARLLLDGRKVMVITDSNSVISILIVVIKDCIRYLLHTN